MAFLKVTKHRLIPGLENSLGRISTTRRGSVTIDVHAYKFVKDHDGKPRVAEKHFPTEPAALAWIKS